ncbi:uncharacterized protein LOC101454405 [Ceratitis capitata]|uniref:(Mediterranean fruit fly) hypothetical protein n=1 Tax=Ceratitis capitata TaxID=7213 RepID=A0A811ULJ2_CERCA|nr:uncharacterized protein LOC101454405 [Ceratitis capitata]CAD6998687.1 unnamed protein product [Ceratitis capitata]
MKDHILGFGSYADNLKVKLPDEYDLVFRLKLPENKNIIVREDKKIPGNVILDLSEILRIISNQRQHECTYKLLKKLVIDGKFLSIKLLQSWLESLFTKVLADLDKRIVYDKSIESTLLYRKQGPAHTIFIKTPYKYSVDFVPAIVVSGEKAIVRSVTLDWDAIPKPVKTTQSDISFRASYDAMENEIIKDKNNLKNALRIIKKFRDVHQNMSKLKSYYIKTLFLWRSKREPPSFWNKPISVIVIELFLDLNSSLEKGHLPFYWNIQFNLYDQIGQSALVDMRRCLESKIFALEKYKKLKVTTLNDDNKIFEMFLTKPELIKLGIKKAPETPEVEKSSEAESPIFKNCVIC